MHFNLNNQGITMYKFAAAMAACIISGTTLCAGAENARAVNEQQTSTDLFVIPSKEKAFDNADYQRETLYPVNRKFLAAGGKYSSDKLLDPTARILSGILPANEIKANIAAAKQTAASSPTNPLALIFLFLADRKAYDNDEWQRRFNTCQQSLRKDHFYTYLLHGLSARITGNVQSGVLLGNLMAIAMQQELSPREQQFILRVLDSSGQPNAFWLYIHDQIKKINPRNSYLKNTMLGKVHTALAWKSRGSGWASTVTEAGWAGFRNNLIQAGKLLTEAWEANKDLPEAAAQMIKVSMGINDKKGCIKWFNRAVAADISYKQSYDNIKYALLPRWMGSNEELVKLGNTCYETGMHKEGVAIQLIQCLVETAKDPDPVWNKYFKAPGTLEKIEDCIYTSRIKLQGDTPTNRNYYHAYMAIYNYYVGNFDKCEEIIGKLGMATFSRCQQDIYTRFPRLVIRNINVTEMINLFKMPYGAKLKQAEICYNEGKAQEAMNIAKELMRNTKNMQERMLFINLLIKYRRASAR